ncbi:DUF3592 domain-containing protein [Massilia sp. TWP1-3-3]|uniref:DUF3592 domain-containing protein n=1 Tax=Massilia sp. TWP1-3-3 TaxID=2804573 RepID=UPI003CEC79C8
MSSMGLPREVPLRVRLNLYVRSIMNIVGFSLFLFGAVFVAVAQSMADFGSTMQFRDSDPVTMGQLVDKRQTGNRSGGRRGFYVFKYKFAYVAGSSRYTGVSYAKDIGLMAGSAIPVAYVPGNPGVARIKGMSSGPFVKVGIWLALGAAAICVTGLGILFFGMKKAWQFSFLVRKGVLTTGTVTGKVSTGWTVNGKNEFHVQFQFKHQDGRICTGSVKEHETDLLEDQQLEPVLYDAAKPSNAILVDGLPRQLRSFVPG